MRKCQATDFSSYTWPNLTKTWPGNDWSTVIVFCLASRGIDMANKCLDTDYIFSAWPPEKKHFWRWSDHQLFAFFLATGDKNMVSKCCGDPIFDIYFTTRWNYLTWARGIIPFFSYTSPSPRAATPKFKVRLFGPFRQSRLHPLAHLHGSM